MFYLTTHSTHFIYGYMASDIWLRTILIVRKETRCCHIGYSFQLTARAILYAPSLCYTSRGALAGTRNRHDTKIYEENEHILTYSSSGAFQCIIHDGFKMEDTLSIQTRQSSTTGTMLPTCEADNSVPWC